MNKRIWLSVLFVFTALLPTSAPAAGFVPLKGTYNGLFFETNGFWEQSSGLITIATTSRGSYTARLQVGLKRYSFSGQLDADGAAAKDILRFLRSPLRVRFHVDANDPDLISGSVSSDTWTADLFADRAVFDGRTTISPDAGQYTMILPGDFTATNGPGGAGIGTITIDRAGRLRFAGSLADGTRVSQATTVSKNGQWPLYAPVYWGEGSLYGWLLFNSSTNQDLAGDATWIKPEMPWVWYYPRGFAVTEMATGSRYVRPPRGTRVLDLTGATIEFNGGNLDRGITNHVTLDSNNRIQNLSANGLRLWFSLANGSFTGIVMDPITWDWIPFRGVVLQRQTVAAGYFPGLDQTGEVWLQSE